MKYFSYIKTAQYLDNYKLLVEFEDGVKKVIDVEPFLKKSKHSIIRRFLAPERFKEFRVDIGTVCWGDNEFDLSPESIYWGEFDARENFRSR